MIDIVLATYNGEKYVGEQIDSIINQTYKEWKLIIRDDGSKDKTSEVLEMYAQKDSRIKVIKDGIGNLGFNGNFTKLLEASSSDYVMICDQDDFWIPEKIEIMFNEIKKYDKKDKILVHSDVYLTNEKLEIISDKFIGKRGIKQGINGVIMANSVQGASCLMTKRLKDSYLNNKVSMPYDYNICLIAEMTGKRIYIEKPLMYYRQHQSNAIGAGVEKDSGKNKIVEFISRKFSLKLIKMELGKFEQISKLKDSLYSEMSSKVRKDIEDYLYISDNKKSALIKSFIFYKNRYTMYRRIDGIIGAASFFI
jgi:rhamnosyltransferase